MSFILDFTKQKKTFYTVKLDDEKKTVLLISTPTKAILDEFIAINERLSDTEEEISDKEALNDLYGICAKVMSFNKGGIKITADYLGSFFTVQDIKIFFSGYTSFISSMTNSKN